MASLRKRDGARGTTYRVMWRLADGEQRSKSFKSHDAAKSFRNDVEAQELAGRAPDPQRGAVTLTAWSESFMATLHLKPKSEAAYRSLLRSRILPSLGDRQLSSITRLQVQQWIAGMAKELSARRTQSAYALLSQMLAEAVRHSLIPSNPADGLSVPKAGKTQVNPLTLAEVKAVASHSGRYDPLVLWLGVMGTRWAEAIGMTWDRVVDGIAVIDSSLSEVNGRFHRVATKNDEIRRLPIPPLLLAQLPQRQDGLIFQTTYGNPVRSAKFRSDVFLPALTNAGVGRIKIHHLRHTCASLLIQQGSNPKIVQQWLGHKDIKMTMDLYSHLYPNDLKLIAAKMDGMLSVN